MQITIVAVGLRQPGWADEAVKDYLSRFPKDFKVSLKEVRAETRSGQTAQKLMQAEAARILKAVPDGAALIALDERGKDLTTMAFADMIRRHQDEGRDMALIIGGADGLDAELKRSCSGMIRLSSMTLPHAFARVLLSEQIYRAWSILNNHPYHRA